MFTKWQLQKCEVKWNASEALQFILNSDNESSDQSSDETTDEESEEGFSPNLQDKSLSEVSSLLLLLANISQGRSRVDIYIIHSWTGKSIKSFLVLTGKSS